MHIRYQVGRSFVVQQYCYHRCTRYVFIRTRYAGIRYIRRRRRRSSSTPGESPGRLGMEWQHGGNTATPPAFCCSPPPSPPTNTTMVKKFKDQRFQISTQHTSTIYEHTPTQHRSSSSSSSSSSAPAAELYVRVLRYLYVDEPVGQVERGGPSLPWYLKVVCG